MQVHIYNIELQSQGNCVKNMVYFSKFMFTYFMCLNLMIYIMSNNNERQIRFSLFTKYTKSI